MKRIFKKAATVCIAVLVLYIDLMICDVIRFEVTGESTLLSFILWDIAGFMPRYHFVMDITVEGPDGTPHSCKLYRRNGSPFLLIGPYPFREEGPARFPLSDFFFVERERARGRSLGPHLDFWADFYDWLWIAYDLDPKEEDSIVPNFYFDTKRVEDSATGLVHFTCSGNLYDEVETFRFAIPKHLLDALPEYREKTEK